MGWGDPSRRASTPFFCNCAICVPRASKRNARMYCSLPLEFSSCVRFTEQYATSNQYCKVVFVYTCAELGWFPAFLSRFGGVCFKPPFLNNDILLFVPFCIDTKPVKWVGADALSTNTRLWSLQWSHVLPFPLATCHADYPRNRSLHSSGIR